MGFEGVLKYCHPRTWWYKFFGEPHLSTAGLKRCNSHSQWFAVRDHFSEQDSLLVRADSLIPYFSVIPLFYWTRHLFRFTHASSIHISEVVSVRWSLPTWCLHTCTAASYLSTAGLVLDELEAWNSPLRAHHTDVFRMLAVRDAEAVGVTLCQALLAAAAVHVVEPNMAWN